MFSKISIKNEDSQLTFPDLLCHVYVTRILPGFIVPCLTASRLKFNCLEIRFRSYCMEWARGALNKLQHGAI